MSRFVRPHTTTLALTGGDTITIKTRLSAGEEREAFARMYLAGADGKLHANPLQTGLAMMVAYLIDWNLTDDDGQSVPIRGLPIADLESVVNTLDPDSFAEVKLAIERHEASMRAARDTEKKTPSGEPSDAAISPSPSVADGVLIGSAISDPDDYSILVDLLNNRPDPDAEPDADDPEAESAALDALSHG